jgi:hypothetical protein
MKAKFTIFLSAIAIASTLGISLSAVAAPKPAAKERKLYVGADSTEAIMTFSHEVEINSETKPTVKVAKEHIENQLTHLFGPMGEARYPAVPNGNHTVDNVKVTPKLSSSNTWLARYDYEGTIVVKNGPTNEYEIILPVNPETVYEAGMSGRRNPCTDHHYQSEGDFWYFWNPKNPGCRMKEGVDYSRLKAKIKRLANSKSTYPEYERLPDSDGVIKISLLMGMDDPKKGRDPNNSTDINAKNFRDIKASLIDNGRGYKNSLADKRDILEVLGRSSARNLPYVEDFKKTIKNGNKEYTLWVQIFFGPSGIDEGSDNFHYFFKDALENSAVMMYDGHSGLGGHLDLASIEDAHNFRIAPNKRRYQIYFFNSCSSYTYYNSMFFGRKATASDENGTKNLDILTNGLATYFSVMHDTNLALIKAIEAWAAGKASLNYQTIARQIDSGNLFGINGDEDNPTRP